MIPRIAETTPTQGRYLAFIASLREAGFRGELCPDYANRTVLGTDNSIYQLLPQGVVYPRDEDDLVVLARLASEERFRDVVLAARGGGTGTNGQSLTDGLVVDVSKHMNKILEIDAAKRRVRVQTGVVKDQLNAALAPHGLFFAPELSTSNRATIGGMINTDASGQGSCLYGKTREHVLSLKSVLLGGTVWESHPLADAELDSIQARDDRVGEAHRVVDGTFRSNAGLIAERFPKLNRCLTGYDLAHIRDPDGRFDLNAILCGAEGTLAFISEATLNVVPVPRYSALVNVRYASFQDTLRDAQALMQAGPASIEAVDSKVLQLAMNDVVWDTVQEFFPVDDNLARGVNLVEYTADDEAELRAGVRRLTERLEAAQGQPGRSCGYTVAYGEEQVKRVWTMRKKSVGLLGNAEGERRPVPFVEDTAVPPEHLADYIMEFRAVLDSHGLDYGMFGHVDAGVLHVRPALDLKDPEQERHIREISDAVEALTRKYHGLLWGEHGKGVRSEYAPDFFGPLYPALQQIKAAFDPHNQLNPGKICTPPGQGELLKIDQVPTRGQRDRQIPEGVRGGFSTAMHCNGNGACYNFDPDDPMCPSWKGTRERIHSPKGRAQLTKEWLRLLALQGADPLAESRRLREGEWLKGLPSRVRNTLGRRRGEYDFSHEVQAAMAGCLACKSCASQCPIRVDVPDFRAQFLELYYGRYLRPAKDYLVGGLEAMLPRLSRFPAAYNAVMESRLAQRLLRGAVGLVDNPRLSGIDLVRESRLRGIFTATPDSLQGLSGEDKARAVVIVQDAFTSYFETKLVLDVFEVLQGLGFVPYLAPFRPNGKPLHVHGFLGPFAKVAGRNADGLRALAQSGVPLVGIDPSMTLTYRAEYVKSLGPARVPRVQLLQEWLANHSDRLQAQNLKAEPRSFELLGHCTEKTTAAASIRDWQTVFAALGHSVTPVATGCCGMAGTYGHEAAHLETSKRIYALSWGNVVKDLARRDRLLADGYSCRSQVKRLDGFSVRHPLQALLGQMSA
jgi:FAD/FMN-containing dehydrogenase/Fe-S oxidoreductase